MSEPRKSIHGEWSSRLVFILAAAGSAVGLGNVWKFPYLAGVNGGGAFVLIYLATAIVIAIPIMMAEIMLGRHGRRSPINTMRTLAHEAHASRWWFLVGGAGILAGFLILSYYSVIAGWAVSYVFKAAAGSFKNIGSEGTHAIFVELVSDPWSLLMWHTVVMVSTMFIVARGVKSGLEQAVTWMMPALFLTLLVLVGYAISSDGFMQGVKFLFAPDFSKITREGVLAAMGQAFFSLSLGMGTIMMYGSYLKSHVSIAQTAFIVASLDTLVAILAGLVIFPLVFTYGLQAGAGPGLVFETMPIAFGQMPGGTFFGALFFLLLVFAAWSSTISLIEPAVAWLVENHKFSRTGASVVIGFSTWLTGIATVLSFNAWSDVKLFGKTPFDLIDFLTSNVMLPLGGLLIAVFAGWVMSAKVAHRETGIRNPALHSMWYFLLRYVAPVGIVLVFLNVIGVL